MKHIIIGGVAGGATAAARIRRADESAEIILLEKGKYVSYANCGLPYYIGGVIPERERLFVQTPEGFAQQFNIDVRIENEVIAIESAAKKVIVRRANGTEYTESYDKLLLSPGATPVRPPLDGIGLEGIFTLRNVDDTDDIKNYISAHEIKEAVVIGAGFIGLEMAENLHHAGANVSIVEMGNQVMAPIDFSMAAIVHQHLLQKGVTLFLEESVEGFTRDNGRLNVRMKSGKVIPADMVILSIGVRPATGLAKDAGLKIGEAGGIWVDEYLRTSDESIYAVGDAIEFPHPLTGKPWLNYLANPANRQGRIVADNMVFGDITKYEGAIGTSIAKVFDMTVASTGLPAKRLKQMDIPSRSSWTHSASHAGYYPDAMPLYIKITFDPVNGKLYGGQGVGYEGVDKRIDQIALIIKKGGTIYDLIKLEHAYAPPYSSAKDPIAIAGYVASNIISGAMPAITWREMETADRENVTILDVRTAEEFSMGEIPGAVNIPLAELRERIPEIPKNKPVYIYCAAGLRGYLASKILFANGFKDIYNLSGGYKTYSAAVASVEKAEPQILPENTDNMDRLQNDNSVKTVKIDAVGLQCPGPVMKLKQAMDSVAGGERVEVTATDAGFARDAQAWSNTTGNKFISKSEDKGKFTVLIEKSGASKAGIDHAAGVCPTSMGGKGKTFIMFSDDLDKSLATFVLANGAAATGEKVTIFFTFWGLNVIKKTDKPKIKKDMFAKMFGMMMPSDSLKLKLSKMNMGGLGRRMMRSVMKRKGVESLESLREQAIEHGVEFIACQMSMEVMGVGKEELLDNVTVGGVATYMERADKANVNLFV